MLRWRMTLNCYVAQSSIDSNNGSASNDLASVDPSPRVDTAPEHASTNTSLFPYHVDIAQNGAVTAVLTLGSPGCIQFAVCPDYANELDNTNSKNAFADRSSPETITLPPGSILVASNEARWNFMHRVVDLNQTQSTDNTPFRFSLVFGCQ
eukprot:m.131875 g.131875  ORF g.131875 m.131875 type:complete len:151 (+) comp29573_c0_seq3:591-1043(+)